MKNMQSALKHTQVVQKYLAAKIKEQRLAGPFLKSLIPSQLMLAPLRRSLSHINQGRAIPPDH